MTTLSFAAPGVLFACSRITHKHCHTHLHALWCRKEGTIQVASQGYKIPASGLQSLCEMIAGCFIIIELAQFDNARRYFNSFIFLHFPNCMIRLSFVRQCFFEFCGQLPYYTPPARSHTRVICSASHLRMCTAASRQHSCPLLLYHKYYK